MKEQTWREGMKSNTKSKYKVIKHRTQDVARLKTYMNNTQRQEGRNAGKAF